MSKNKTSNYHESLHGLVEDVQTNYLNLNNATSNEFETHTWEAVGYGETCRESFKLDSLKNKILGGRAKRHLQVVIYRMENGKYELICYS
tara:strand:- start:31 stop:300 length:270 start_codon:yes stop_codon:yes gene_type:complete